MNELNDLIAPDAILPRVVASTRRNALQQLVEALAKVTEIDPRAAFDAVLMRERLAGTGVGEGVAIPHAAVSGLTRPVAAYARLETPLDFDALDARPVDLVFLLLAPPERCGDHLKALARVSRFFRRADLREKLRAARGVDDIYALFSASIHSDAA